MKKLLFILSILIIFSSQAQTNLDSLHQVWLDETQPDTIRYRAMEGLIMKDFIFSKPDTAFSMAQQLLEESKQKKNRKWQAMAYYLQGGSFYIRGNHAQALYYYQQCLEIVEDIGDKQLLIQSLLDMGGIYVLQNNIQAGLKNFNQSLAVSKEIDYKKGVAFSLSTIGYLYKIRGNYAKARESANQSLEVHRELKNKRGISICLNLLGEINQELGNYDEAINLITHSLEIRKEINSQTGIANCLNIIGSIYIDVGNLELGEEVSKESLKISRDVGSVEEMEKAAKNLSNIYEKQGKISEAFDMYKLQIEMKDSLKSEEVSKQVAQAESRAQLEKELFIKEQEEKEAARIKAEEISTRNNIQYSGIGLGIFALFGLLFFVGNFSLPTWVLELSVFLPFLIFFEFLLVLTDPYIDSFTGGEPIMKLLLNALLAGAIFPLHAFFEKLMKKRLIKA